MKVLIEKIVAKLRKQPDYEIKGDYSGYETFLILYYRLWQVLRGLRIRIVTKSKGIIFAGKKVKIEFPRLFSAGSSLIIEDNAKINALSAEGVKLGRNVNIGKNVIIICTGVIANKGIGLRVGNRSAIGAQSFIGAQGGVEIGDDVIFGPDIKMFSENHNFDSTSKPIRLQGETRKGIKIGNNCWIGARSTILTGVTIGDGCVIASGSIVSKDVPENSIYYNKITPVLKSRINENSNNRNQRNTQ